MKKVFTIAEAGVNHNGSLDLAKKLIHEALKAKANAVKFRIYRSELCLSKTKKKAKYKVKNTGDSVANQYEIVKTLELIESIHHELASLYMHPNL